VIIKNNLVSQ